ncbi:hypothetical protein AAMO2058_001484300 [Amorphochlora amoebiformis]
MGADSSKPEIRYKKELLKLSWRVVLTVQNQANKDSKDPSFASSASAEEKRKTDDVSIKTDKHIQPFHEDFEAQFIKYCPDVAKKFPTDFALVSKMIQTFISNAIDSKEIGPLAKRFAKSHKKYKLEHEHFDGFAQALVDTLQTRLGKFGTIELIKIWREVTNNLVSHMEKVYNSK